MNLDAFLQAFNRLGLAQWEGIEKDLAWGHATCLMGLARPSIDGPICIYRAPVQPGRSLIPFHSISFGFAVVVHDLSVGVGSNASPVKFPLIVSGCLSPFALLELGCLSPSFRHECMVLLVGTDCRHCCGLSS